MFDFEFAPTEDGARTTEGWVKHDLENSLYDTYWLDCAASDAIAESPNDPEAYLLALLSNVNVPDDRKVEALVSSLIRTLKEA